MTHVQWTLFTFENTQWGITHRIPRLVLKMITTELGLLKLNNLERTTTMKPILTGNIQALDMIY